jgi:hypothetical protein
MQKINTASIRFQYSKKHDRIMMTAGCAWGLYLENTAYLFMRAFNSVRNKINKDFEINISLTDNIEEIPEDKYYWGFGTSKKEYMNRLIPSPFFVNWNDCQIKDYDEECNEIYSEGQKAPIYDKCFWAGNINTNRGRKEFYEKFKDNNHFEIFSMGWTNSGPSKIAKPTAFISMAEQTKYKYLIDFRGNGWSGRLPFLMFSNRPIFYVAREPVAFFENDLKPFVHYIPVKADLSDLEEKYIWAEENYEEAKQIAKNMTEYALTHLKKDMVIKYYADKILDYANNYSPKSFYTKLFK